ncbi:isopentenyl diphosphate isomerase/L-lactate dehydrogenase-like FMN-dependent dehydrogenase [Bacillus oleivorans]|uniref:L-lactate oxidase n=1 Tax=Bacillus oleivorans TaxID=1448271 RepID=A0A285CIN3_9BACI|nr:alpha-hydroxy-acid oxidizing protein [Bacillus oleivorans]SNX67215.1 isopentenyl diphosphate isomerase/L-lactate dehydrogenase-like FMN-dependent dehydrogenase [Bacillus oleivorans]
MKNGNVSENNQKEVSPISARDWEKLAKEILNKEVFDYIARGSGEEATMKANQEAFNQWKIVPRILRDVSKRDTSISLFGYKMKSPILLAPVGVQIIAHPDGELATARAAAKMRIPLITSSASTFSMEEIAQEMGDSPRWFQLFLSNQDRITKSMVKRAEASGYTAIVVTVDMPVLGFRECDITHGYSPIDEGKGIGNYLSDPAFCKLLEKSPQEDMMAAIKKQGELLENPTLKWEDVRKLRKYTKLPILLKGIVHPDDAKLAIQYKADGIIVSNHGGRQLDHAIASLDALEQVCQVVQGKIPVLFDSGIRRGTDIIKAIALGATAVLIGRPYIYGLVAAGEEGVIKVMKQILKELDISMALAGLSSMAEINKSILVRGS